MIFVSSFQQRISNFVLLLYFILLMKRAHGLISVQIVGTKGDTSPMLQVFFTTSKYLINCGEGFQRFCCSQSVGMGKSIFLTDLSWESTGGLSGTILTLAERGQNDLTIWGPRHTGSLINSFRYYINRPKLKITTNDVENMKKDVFSDDQLDVFPILIQKNNEPSNDDDMDIEEQGEGGEESSSVTQTLINKRNNPKHVQGQRSFLVSSPSTSICCYAMHSPIHRGKFNAQKAKELGVTQGKLFGKLYEGEAVKNEAGELIQPEQVMGPDVPGSIVLVVKCPTEDYMSSLTLHEKWDAYHHRGEHSDNVMAVYHMSPPEVIDHPTYQEWTSKFPSSTKHIAINGDCTEPFVIRKAAEHHGFFSKLDNDIFPPLFAEYEKKVTSCLPDGFTQGKILDKMQMRPRVDVVVDGELRQPNTDDDYSSLKSEYLPPLSKYTKWDDTDITFLGTGSCIPGPVRNVSAIHISLEHGKYGFLMDAGEGTLGQMRRVFGLKLQEVLSSLKFILITHMHPDHHTGINNIIQAREKLDPAATPLLIVGPVSLGMALEEYNEIHPQAYKFHNILQIKEINDAIGIFKVGYKPVHVIHCPFAYGFVVRHQSGWKIVYSGDTRPCNELVKAGKKATLLIHEATFESEKIKDAKIKRHSTVEEAIEIGQRMGADYTVLTHFSQRYPEIPLYRPGEGENTVGIAFDYMRLKFSWLNRFPLLLPKVKDIFMEREEEKEQHLTALRTKQAIRLQKKLESREPKRKKAKHSNVTI